MPHPHDSLAKILQRAPREEELKWQRETEGNLLQLVLLKEDA
jgi:hypothetical protein